MNLNHINLAVTDVPSAVAFLETYFELRKTGGNAGMAFLTDDSGFVLTLMKAPRSQGAAYPGNFHIGFFVESEAAVDEVNRRLKEAGYDVAPPGGFTVELGA